MNKIRHIFRYTTGLRPLVVIIAIGSMLGAVSSFATPVIIKSATDWAVGILQGTQSFGWSRIVVYAALLIGLSVVGTIIGDIGGYCGDQLAIRTRKQLSTAYYQHLLALPQRYYDNEITGTIINRLSRAITDITNFLQFFSNNLLQLLLVVSITVVVLVFYSWPLAILFLALVPLNLYLTAKTSTLWQKLEAKKNHHFDIASGRFAEAIAQMRMIKSFGSEQREHTFFSGEMTKMVNLTRRQSRHWHTMNVWRGVAYGVVNALILVMLFYLAAHKTISLGDMAMLIALVQQASLPLRNLSFFVDSYQRAVANSTDFLKAMAEPTEPPDTERKPLKVRDASVVFNNVSFGYGDTPDVLKGISFTVEQGKRLALVGESGSGKTTISNLVMGLYKPLGGVIAISGQDIGHVRHADVRAAIATVFQDPALFSGTIRENIAYGKPTATDDEIMAAARAANAEAFIAQLPNGLATEIGERGLKLSGGQKQRIAIARAIIKDAPILILDEATSSLDSKAEHEVQLALDRLMKNRTTLIIAHRLSTIASVDTIVTIANGAVDEIGTPAQLSRTGGIYAELLTLQLHATARDKKRLARYEISA